MPYASEDTRNALAAALAMLLSGCQLVLLSATGTELASVSLPTLESVRPGVLVAGPLAAVIATGSGAVDRYEVRRGNKGVPLLSGSGAEIKVEPSSIVARGLVYIDSFTVSL